MVDIDTISLCLFIPVLSLFIPELSPTLEQTFRFSSKDAMVSERHISKAQEETNNFKAASHKRILSLRMTECITLLHN